MGSNKKCYEVLIKNVARFLNLDLPEVYKAYAIKFGDNLKEIVTGKIILVGDTPVLNPIEFVSANAQLFAIKATEISKEEFLSHIELLKNTNINDYLKTIKNLSDLTVKVTERRYNNLLEDNKSRKR